jgi:N-acetylated-alpha-linked acidic dipeptidase
LPDSTATGLNGELIQIQRTFVTEQGLPERPWFKHQVYAPGAYTGYGAKPIAAVREYMDQERWKEAEAQVPIVGQVLENVAAAIGKAAEDMERAASRAQ